MLDYRNLLMKFIHHQYLLIIFHNNQYYQYIKISEKNKKLCFNHQFYLINIKLLM